MTEGLDGQGGQPGHDQRRQGPAVHEGSSTLDPGLFQDAVARDRGPEPQARHDHADLDHDEGGGDHAVVQRPEEPGGVGVMIALVSTGAAVPTVYNRPRPMTALLADVPYAPDSAGLEPPGSGWSATHEPADEVDDPVDVAVGEVGEERQGDLLLVVLLGDRAHAPPVAEVGVERVPVDGDVVDLHPDAVGAQVVEHRPAPAVADPQGVQVPRRLGARAGRGSTSASRSRRPCVVAGVDLATAREKASSRASWLDPSAARTSGRR